MIQTKAVQRPLLEALSAPSLPEDELASGQEGRRCTRMGIVSPQAHILARRRGWCGLLAQPSFASACRASQIVAATTINPDLTRVTKKSQTAEKKDMCRCVELSIHYRRSTKGRRCPTFSSQQHAHTFVLWDRDRLQIRSPTSEIAQEGLMQAGSLA